MSNKVSYIIQLKDQFSRTAAQVSKQFKAIKYSAEKTTLSMKEFARKTKDSLNSVRLKLLAVGAAMTASISLPITMMARSMVKAASDAEETANKFNAVFRDISPAANKTADDFAKKFSLAGSSARKMIGNTGDLLVGFQFASDQALELSKTVTTLALDLDSFQNFHGGVEGASMAITKALLGETESMKSLGVSIQQNTKDFRDQVQAVMATKNVTERQAKALVILKQVQDQTRAATNDYLNTLNNSYAGAVRKNIQANIKFKESFGKLLLPIATKMVDMATRLAEWISNLSLPTKRVILLFAGLTAVVGPLLLLLAAGVFVFAAIGGAVMAIGGAIGLLIAAGVALWLNWKEVLSGAKLLWSNFCDMVIDIAGSISDAFSNVWNSAKSGLVSFINIGIGLINRLLAPLNFVSEKLGLGTLNLSPLQAPVAPTSDAGGKFDAELTVKAEPGTTVRNVRSRNRGSSNIGVNMVTQ